jgi:hypothetical protein
MHRHAWFVLAALCALLFVSPRLSAANGGESPFTMKRFEAVMIDSTQRRARLTLIAETTGSGEITVTLDLPASGCSDDGSVRLLAGERSATVKGAEGQQNADKHSPYIHLRSYYLVSISGFEKPVVHCMFQTSVYIF